VQVFVKIRGRFGQNIAQPQNPTESGKFVWIKKSLNKNDRDPGARKSQLCHAERSISATIVETLQSLETAPSGRHDKGI
jgi:hypothetical protein